MKIMNTNKEDIIFKNTNYLLKGLFKEFLKIENNNESLIKLNAKEHILNYADYYNKYIFFIPEFFIYFVEENLKEINILNIIDENDKENNNNYYNNNSSNSNSNNNIFSIIDTIANSDFQFELNDQRIKEYEAFQGKKSEENNFLIQKLIKEINELSLENENLNQDKLYQEKEYITKKQQILEKFNSLKNEKLNQIEIKVQEIKKIIHIRNNNNNNNHYDLFFGEYQKFKENFEKALISFEENNEINEFEIFSFDVLSNYIEKYKFDTEKKLEISKNNLFKFVDQRLCRLNEDAINSKNEIKLNIEKQNAINKKLNEEIVKLQKEENILIEKIRIEKDNFFIKRNNLPDTTILIELKKGLFDLRFIVIIWFLIIFLVSLIYF
jgi:hypothetical protein